MRVIAPAADATVVDETERPLLDWLVDRAPDVDLRISLALLDQLVCDVAEDLANAVLSRDRITINVGDGQSGVGKLVGGEFAGLHAVLADSEYIGDHDVRACHLLD